MAAGSMVVAARAVVEKVGEGWAEAAVVEAETAVEVRVAVAMEEVGKGVGVTEVEEKAKEAEVKAAEVKAAVVRGVAAVDRCTCSPLGTITDTPQMMREALPRPMFLQPYLVPEQGGQSIE